MSDKRAVATRTRRRSAKAECEEWIAGTIRPRSRVPGGPEISVTTPGDSA